MQDRLKALKILGLSEEATRQEIETRYFHLVKKYKYLAYDEQPSWGEPIFSVINEAYRLLIGFVPMQRIEFKQLKWKEKLEHIREYYLLQIVLCVIAIGAIFSLGLAVHDISKNMQTKTTNTNVTSTKDNPFSVADCKDIKRKLP
jgi:hypothetical protein